MLSVESKARFFIYGGCVSRDVFELKDVSGECAVSHYASRTILGSIADPPWDSPELYQVVEGNFQRRCIREDMQKNVLREVGKKNYDFILMDLVSDARLGLVQLPGGVITYTGSVKSAMVKTGIRGTRIRNGSDEFAQRRDKGLRRFLSALEDAGRINTLYINRVYVDESIQDRESGVESELINENLRVCYEMISAYVKGHQFIDYDPKVLKADPSHKWGHAPFHFIGDFYEAQARSLKRLVASREEVPEGRGGLTGKSPSGHVGARRGFRLFGLDIRRPSAHPKGALDHGVLPPNVHEFPLRRGEHYGQVATNCAIATGTTKGGRPSYFGYQRHVLRTNVTEIAVRFPNWYVNRAGMRSEYAVSGQTAYSISIEYPLGTLTSLTFNGNNQGWANAGGDVCSDFVPMKISEGTRIWVRVASYGSSAWAKSGTPHNPLVRSGSVDHERRVQDRTRMTSMKDPGPRDECMKPIGIIARTRHGAILGIGDSLVQGSGDKLDISDSIGLVERAVSETHAFINAGVGGDTIAGILASGNKRLSQARYVKNLILEHGVNGLGDADLHTVMQQMLALWSMSSSYTLVGSRLFQTTITPSAKSTDRFATIENQTPTTGFEFGKRSALNDWLRDGAPIFRGTVVPGGTKRATRAGDKGHPLHAVFDVADVLESSRNSGLWKANGKADWLTRDGLHPNRQGYLLVKQSGAIDVRLFS